MGGLLSICGMENVINESIKNKDNPTLSSTEIITEVKRQRESYTFKMKRLKMRRGTYSSTYKLDGQKLSSNKQKKLSKQLPLRKLPDL